MHNVVKWPKIFLKSCSVNTARFLKHVWPFYNIMHKRVNPDSSKTFDQHKKSGLEGLVQIHIGKILGNLEVSQRT